MRVVDAILTVLDFEGTGVVKGYPNEPWQVGMVTMKQGTVCGEETWESLLRVGERPFNAHAPGNHAQRRGEIAAAPTLQDLWPSLAPRLLDRPLVAHNVATERGFLQQTAPLHRFAVWIDTLQVARYAYPDAPSHKLEDLLRQLDLEHRVHTLCPGRRAHDALFDAVGCAVLLEHFLSLPGWQDVTAAALAGVKATVYHQRLLEQTLSPRHDPRAISADDDEPDD